MLNPQLSAHTTVFSTTNSSLPQQPCLNNNLLVDIYRVGLVIWIFDIRFNKRDAASTSKLPKAQGARYEHHLLLQVHCASLTDANSCLTLHPIFAQLALKIHTSAKSAWRTKRHRTSKPWAPRSAVRSTTTEPFVTLSKTLMYGMAYLGHASKVSPRAQLVLRAFSERDSLSTKAKANLCKLQAHGRHKKSRNTLPRQRQWGSVIKTTQSDIALPQKAEDVFYDWQKDPSLFDCSANPVIASGTTSSVILGRYQQILAFECQQYLDRVKLRFYMLFIFDLCTALEVRRVGSRVIDSLTAFLFCADSSLESDVVRQNLSDWRSYGARYSALVDSLSGEGCLFLLPSCVSERV